MATGDQPIDTSTVPGITDAEASDLAAVIRVVSSDCSPPTVSFAVPLEGATELFHFICGWLRKFDVPIWLARMIGGIVVAPLLVINQFFSILVKVLRPLLEATTQEVLGLLDTLRKELDPSVANVAVSILNELLGTDYQVGHLAAGTDVESHLARASAVGGILHDQLIGEFKASGDVTPEAGRAAARRFSGFLINFGTATGIIATLGGLVPFIHLDEVREIGEEVARNLGLGRLHRQVMKPLINTLITQPYTWWMNLQFHPTQFKEGDLINPYQATLMPHDQIFHAMDLLGYSQDKIEELIKLHQKRLTLDDLDLLLRYSPASAQFVSDYQKTLGYPDELAETALKLVDMRRADASVRALVDAMETYAADGHITADEFAAMLDQLPLGTLEKRFRAQVVQFKVKAPHAHLTVAQAQKAFEEGLLTLDDLQTYFDQRGYSLQDNQTLQVLTLLALAKLEEAAKVKAAKAAAAAAKAAAKAAKASPPAGG